MHHEPVAGLGPQLAAERLERVVLGGLGLLAGDLILGRLGLGLLVEVLVEVGVVLDGGDLVGTLDVDGLVDLDGLLGVVGRGGLLEGGVLGVLDVGDVVGRLGERLVSLGRVVLLGHVLLHQLSKTSCLPTRGRVDAQMSSAPVKTSNASFPSARSRADTRAIMMRTKTITTTK